MKKEEKTKKKHMKWYQTLRVKISFVILASIVIAVLVDFEYMLFVSQKTLMDNTQSAVKTIIESQSRLIDESIEKFNSTMVYIDGSDEINVFEQSGGSKFGNQISLTMNKYMEKNPLHNSLSYVSAQTQTVLASTDKKLVGTDCSDMVFIQKILTEQENAQSNVLIDEESGEATISIGVVQHNDKNDGTIAGALFTNINASLFTEEVANIKVNNIEGSYACLLDSEGVYIYHPDQTQIGKKTTDPVILKTIGGKSFVTSMTLNELTNEYEACTISSRNGWILSVFVPKAQLLRPITNMKVMAVLINIVIIAILSAIAFLFASSIIKPVKKITDVIDRTANLDFGEDAICDRLMAKKDEIGRMSRAVVKMRKSIAEIMGTIDGVSGKISDNSNTLEKISNAVKDNASDNCAATEQLYASMNVTKSNTDQMTLDVSKISEYAAAIKSIADEGVCMSKEIQARAMHMKQSTIDAEKTTGEIYATVKEETEEAIRQSKSITRINEFAENIKDIATQTRLLSLNASIEAARAGETGKGFAVVADEIGKLAKQSSMTVESITQIVEEVVVAVNNLTESMSKILGFLDQNVMRDYDGFVDISEQYAKDADHIENTMAKIDTSISGLSDSVRMIFEMIGGISTAMDESTVGLSEVASGTGNILDMIEDTYRMAGDTLSYAGELDDIVMKFKI